MIALGARWPAQEPYPFRNGYESCAKRRRISKLDYWNILTKDIQISLVRILSVLQTSGMTIRAFDLAHRLADQNRLRDAFRVFLTAARRGDTSVFVNLGYAYDVGRGVRKSKRKALHWYRRALAEGEGAAAHNIGTVYRDRGQRVRAARYFREAIALGHGGSNLELGQLLLGGLGQPAEALACFRNVGEDESETTIEAAKSLAVVAEEASAP